MLWPAIKKDTLLLARDRGTLLSLFLLPIIFVSVFGSLFGKNIDDATSVRTLAIAYTAEDAAAQQLVLRIEDSKLFRLRTMEDAESLRRWVMRDPSRVGLIVPPGFDELRSAELVIDTGTPIRFRSPIEGAVRTLVELPPVDQQAHMATLQVRSPPGVRSAARTPSGFQVSVPGNAVLFGFFLVLTMALSFGEDRKTGTWRRLLAAPVSRPVLLVAKLVPYYVIGLVQMSFLFGVGALFFGMQVAGSVLALIALTMVVVFAAVALGLLIASLGGSERQVGSVGSISLLVMGLLGGAMIPRISMPETMQKVGLATPHAWALDGYYDLLVRPGAGFAEVWPCILAVLAFALVFLAVGAARFRFED